MSNSIVITLPHHLGVEEAKRRIAGRIELLRRDYIDKLAYSEVNWNGEVTDWIAASNSSGACGKSCNASVAWDLRFSRHRVRARRSPRVVTNALPMAIWAEARRFWWKKPASTIASTPKNFDAGVYVPPPGKQL
jgi:hypothetical protein